MQNQTATKDSWIKEFDEFGDLSNDHITTEELKSFIKSLLSQSNKNTLEEAVEKIEKMPLLISARSINDVTLFKQKVLSTLQELKGKK